MNCLAIEIWQMTTEDKDTRLRDLQARIAEADAEIEAGKGIAFADAKALTYEVLRQASYRVGTGSSPE